MEQSMRNDFAPDSAIVVIFAATFSVVLGISNEHEDNVRYFSHIAKLK